MWLLKTCVAGNAARQWLLIAVSNVLLNDVKRNLAANKARFWGCCRNMGNFLCGVKMVKPYVNAHLHCIVSSLKWASKMPTLPINGKISVNAYACVVYVYNVTYALYCAVNNHFCVIRVFFVTTSRWMCDSPGTGCAWRLTPTYMWRGHAKAKAHIYVIYVNFWEIIVAFPNGGQWAPFSKVCPLAQTSSYATANIVQSIYFTYCVSIVSSYWWPVSPVGKRAGLTIVRQEYDPTRRLFPWARNLALSSWANAATVAVDLKIATSICAIMCCITLLYCVRMPAPHTSLTMPRLLWFMCRDCARLSATNKACKLGGKPPYARRSRFLFKYYLLSRKQWCLPQLAKRLKYTLIR